MALKLIKSCLFGFKKDVFNKWLTLQYLSFQSSLSHLWLQEFQKLTAMPLTYPLPPSSYFYICNKNLKHNFKEEPAILLHMGSIFYILNYANQTTRNCYSGLLSGCLCFTWYFKYNYSFVLVTTAKTNNQSSLQSTYKPKSLCQWTTWNATQQDILRTYSPA